MVVPLPRLPEILPALLLSGMLLLACEGNNRQTQLQPDAISPTTEFDKLKVEEVAVHVMAGADTTILSNIILDKLAPKWSVREVLRKVPEAKIIKKKAVPNRHVKGQVDTLVTLRSDSTVFHFYRLPDKDILQKATLSKGGISLGNGLEVGMLAEEVVQLIASLKDKKTIPQTILIRSEQTPRSLRLRFRNNRLAYINYDGHVD